MFYRLKITLFLCMTLHLSISFAWDSTAHRVISAIAYNNLTFSAKQKIDALTDVLDPNYPPLMRFLYVSTLPDQWRRADQNQTANWHFINLPWSSDQTPTQSAKTPNLITELEAQKIILRDPQANAHQKAAALAYIVHLTEDAHQPLHCINRFSKMFPQGDEGGNAFPIKAAFADNLHAYWDQSVRQIKRGIKPYPLRHKKIMQMATTIATNYPKYIFGESLHNFSVTQWVTESYTLAKEKVYGITPNTKPSSAYNQMLQETAGRQMALAGYRLAGLLNQLFE